MDGMPKCLAEAPTLTDEAVAEQLTQSTKAARRWTRVALGLTAVFIGACALKKWSGYTLFETELAATYQLTVLLGAICQVAVVLRARSIRHDRVYPLRPLAANPEACRQALALTKTSRSAKDWRDSVLASGRQLYQFDKTIMACLLNAEHRAADARERQEACRELHHITT